MTTAVRSSVTAYAEEVLTGRLLAGKLVRLACERHLRDLKEGPARGLKFQEEEAQRAIDFFRILRLPDGVGAGLPFELLPWQQFVVGSLFGWYGSDNRRRFHYALIEVARANGKSPLAAGIGLYALTADQEAGAQVYSAATTRDQAKIVFNDATRMAERSALWPRLTKTVNNLLFNQLQSYFRPLSADASTMDGLRVHVALVDELHEHPNGEVMAKLRTGMKSSQPLLFAITTAGYDRNSVCYEEHEHALKVLEGVVENDAYFAYVASLDDGDSWTDEGVWGKANPSLGLTVRLETLRDECELAKQIPGQQNSFLRLRLNQWTEADSRWLSGEVWDAGAMPPPDLKGRECYASLDLSSTTDISALELLFPDGQGGYDVLSEFWIPEENMTEREHRDRVPFSSWVRDGHMNASEGNVIDYEEIRKKLNELGDTYIIKELAFDPWNASGLITQLMGDGFTCVPIRQGFASLTGPAKELEKLLIGRKLRHGGHPVLRWMANNVSIEQDAAGNIKPSKAKSRERIDGIIAIVMGLSRAMIREEDGEVGISWA